MWTSFNCCSSTLLGAFIITSLAFLFLGKAITSLIFWESAISITILSNPGAAPACGGVPYLKALYKAPNFSSTVFSGYPAISNALTISFGLWFLTAPDAISYPLHTKSNWYATISNGSLFSSASIPPCGIENGLWLKSILPSSSLYSYIGKSTIKQNLYTFFSNKSNLFPSSILTCPAIFWAISNLSAIKNILSPFLAPNSSSNRVKISSETNFAIPPCAILFSSIFVQAKPFAPKLSTANSVILSKNFLPWLAPSGTTIAFIVLSLKALNSVFLNTFVTSWIINGFLKSGLSIPYFSIASLYGILTIGPSSTFQFVCSLKVAGITFSITLKTSSCVAKDISKSNW